MKILFTGASSFTGMWFVDELAKARHHITCTFQRPKDVYSGLRKQRLDRVLEKAAAVFDCPFGSEKFLELIKKQHFDLFCHHAACVEDYKSPGFNFAKALENNTKNIRLVFESLKQKECKKVVLTGSMFEQNEGKGSTRAVSPYGLSKGLTADVFRFFAEIMGLNLGKFVVPTPFGPFEEPRFTSYLMHHWLDGKTPAVSCPDYVRDNIHVSLLSKAYCAFIDKIDKPYSVIRPSQYRESNGGFTERLSCEMRKRFSLPCRYELCKQTDFTEPLERMNDTILDIKELDWDEKSAWDSFAEFYVASGSSLG